MEAKEIAAQEENKMLRKKKKIVNLQSKLSVRT